MKALYEKWKLSFWENFILKFSQKVTKKRKLFIEKFLLPNYFEIS